MPKEIFFLSTDDLKYLDYYDRPKGWGAYAMKTGSRKYFYLNEVRREAMRKYGGAQALIKKAEVLNQRRRNKMERDNVKRQEEQRRREEEQRRAEEQRLAAIEAKKQARLEKKRLAEQQVKDAESWRALLHALEGSGVVLANKNDAISMATLLKNIHAWKESKIKLEQGTIGALTSPKNLLAIGHTGSGNEVSPN